MAYQTNQLVKRCSYLTAYYISVLYSLMKPSPLGGWGRSESYLMTQPRRMVEYAANLPYPELRLFSIPQKQAALDEHIKGGLFYN